MNDLDMFINKNMVKTSGLIDEQKNKTFKFY
jgi:hypothetical protein